jgi:hypothetical protein
MYLSPITTPINRKSPVYRCDKNKSHEVSYSESKIKPNTLTRLLLDPKGTMSEFGIDPNNFKIKYAKSPKITLNNRKIRDFPVLIIRDKTPTSSFVDYLRIITSDPSAVFPSLYESLHDMPHEEKSFDEYPFPLLPPRKTIKIGSGGYPESWDEP